MSNDRSPHVESIARFVATVRKHHTVFGLKSADGEWAVSSSAENEKIDVVLIWSRREKAYHLRTEDWQDYHVTPISAEAFVDTWLKGMHEDGSLVGLDWDATFSGPEVDPIELAEELSKE